MVLVKAIVRINLNLYGINTYMIISDKHEYAFISVPKTGTHTMYELLPDKFNGERYGGYHENILPSHASSYFKFCTVRNPYSKFTSAWSIICNREAIHFEQMRQRLGKVPDVISVLKWAIAERSNLLEYNAERSVDRLRIAPALVPTSAYFKYRPVEIEMDAFIQIENATEQFNLLPFVHEYTIVPKVFSLSSQPYAQTWDDIRSPETIELINELAEDDFEMFNYTKLTP